MMKKDYLCANKYLFPLNEIFVNLSNVLRMLISM